MENAGFARIEIRGNVFKINLHIQNINLEKPDVTVYIFSRNGEIIQGISVGELKIERGSGDMQTAFQIKDLSEFGAALGDLEGIFIPVSDQVFLASQWKEGSLRQGMFRPMKKKEKDEKKEPAPPKIPESPRKPDAPAAEEEEQNGAQERRRDPEEEAKEDGRDKEERANEKRPAQTDEGQPIRATELPEESFFAEREGERAFQKLRLKSELFYPFEGERIECVRMQLGDLRELPKKYWYLGKNSFLLHGFFNYRHILLGETEEGGKKAYFVGVPGVFQNQERIMASLFGFPEFRTAKNTEYKTGNFGYWYRII